MKVSVLTDEISQDPATAIELARDWGIRHMEIRCLYGRRIPDDEPWARKSLLELIESYDVDVAAITPGLFKVSLSDRNAIDQHLSTRLPKSLEFAKAVGTEIVVAFTPVLDGPRDERALSHFRGALSKAIDIMQKEGITLALENEPICVATTGAEVAGFVRSMGRDELRVNWDPGNAYTKGEGASEGYRHVRDLVAHVHLKDVRTDPASGEKRYVTIGQGELKFEEQLRSLRADRYEGYLTIETHFKPPVKGTKECFEGLKSILSLMGEDVE